MTTFQTIRRELSLEFSIKNSAKLESFNGTKFVPNRASTRVFNDEISFITFERIDADGLTEYDPFGPDGSVLAVSYGGGEITGDNLEALPKVVRDALAEIEKAVRR